MLARHRQIGIAQQAVQRATHSFEKNWLRVRDLEGLPIETLQSMHSITAGTRAGEFAQVAQAARRRLRQRATQQADPRAGILGAGRRR